MVDEKEQSIEIVGTDGHQRSMQGFSLGCGTGVTVLLIGAVIALALWAPRWIERLARQGADAGATLVTDSSTGNGDKFAARREAALARLNSYGWVNEEQEVVHIPIDRALSMLAEEGLPVGLDAAGVDLMTAEDAAALAAVDLENVSFADDVLPIFKDRCSECHDWQDPSEDLILTSYSDVMYGSANGEVVVPGDVDNSYLVEQIESGQMPKRRDPLSVVQIALIKAWIEAGAPDN